MLDWASVRDQRSEIRSPPSALWPDEPVTGSLLRRVGVGKLTLPSVVCHGQAQSSPKGIAPLEGCGALDMIGIARAAGKNDLHPVGQSSDSQQVGRTRTCS